MNRTSTASLLTITGLTIIGGLVAYAAYFDYKRRSDPTFRKKLRTQKKKVEQHAAQEKENEATQKGPSLQVPPELLRAIYEKSREEPIPVDTEERHTFFIAVVAQAERLAAEGPQSYLEAAVYFYQALRVYPSPIELIAIYQKTVPEAVLTIVMELYNLDVLGRIHGYYDNFPPKSMNVSVKQIDPKSNKGGQTISHSLVTTKSFRAGEDIYTEAPIVAVLDADVQARGSHCSHCLRPVVKGMAISVEADRLKSIYCSKKCQMQSKVQSQNLLFGNEDTLPAELQLDMPQSAKDARPKMQDAFADLWRKSGSSGLLLVARVVSMQIIGELAKAIPQAAGLKAELPPMCIGGEYTVLDHVERLRYVDVSVREDEQTTLQELLKATLPFLEDAHSDERHAMYRGKMAYNAIGVCFAGGRDDKPPMTESSERTRTPYGTLKQVGSGLYFVSSYLGHSCFPSARPSFSSGTSELHLIATRDLQEGDELTIAYVDVTQHKDESPGQARARRRAELALGWKFACMCAKCEKEAKELDLERDEVKLPATDGSKVEPTLARLDAA